MTNNTAPDIIIEQLLADEHPSSAAIMAVGYIQAITTQLTEVTRQRDEAQEEAYCHAQTALENIDQRDKALAALRAVRDAYLDGSGERAMYNSASAALARMEQPS